MHERQTRTADDWRLQIPDAHRRALRRWLWAVLFTIVAIVVVGGITRLTQSGLSIVRWEPLMGVLPPIGDAQWTERFAQYQQYPEYRQLRPGMTLDQFKVIFFWEYLHRLVARALGVVFLVPWLVFWWTGRLTRPIALRTLGVFALGAAQGALGWFMVASGLVDRPSVSHYRLAAHLGLAFVIVGTVVWLLCELRSSIPRATIPGAARRALRRGAATVGVLLAVQIAWGAFVAGLDAGLAYNTFPLMAGRLVPLHAFTLDPLLANLIQHPAGVQWMHRVLGTALLIAACVVALRARALTADPPSRSLPAAFAAVIALQYALGVLTLLWVVPVSIASAHQLVALALVAIWVAWMHHLRESTAASGT